MASIHFPGTVLQNGTLLLSGWGPAVASDTFLARYSDLARLYIAPGRYSNVRKVVFAVSFQHAQTQGTLATTFRARVGPSATSDSDRTTIETAEIPAATRIITGGGSSVWSNDGPDADAAFYPLQGNENQIAPRQVAVPVATTDAQTCMVTFDRDNPLAADFFADWDAVALLGTDHYIAYAPGIQRDDAGVFTTAFADSDRVPSAYGFHMTVVQTTGPTNKSCTHALASTGLDPNESFAAPNAVAKVIPFTFRETDWNDIESIHVFMRQSDLGGVSEQGAFRLRIFEIANEVAFPGTSVYTEDFGPSSSTIPSFTARSADLRSILQDGKTYMVSFNSLTGSTNSKLPSALWEVVQFGYTLKSSFHFAGAGNPSRVGTMVPGAPTTNNPRFGIDQSVFDPSWFDGLPDDNILARRFLAGLDHTEPNNTDQMAVLNPSLTADIPASGSNVFTDEVSSTPDAETGMRVRGGAITQVDPLTLSGLRVMKIRYGLDDWTSGSPDDYPGGFAFQYTFTVIETPGPGGAPELGPVFAIGSFDPVGCASTAAGLGDNPGVLVMTNGVTLPKKFDPRQGIVENAGIDTPYRDEEPTVTTASVSLSPDGGLTPGIYVYRYTLRNPCTGKESDPNPVDIVVDGSLESPGLAVTLNFAGVLIPADPQIGEICIYRTLIGGDFPVLAKVGCFDPNDTTVFVDELPDDDLDFLNDPLSVFNAPMPCLPVVAEFRNRLFGLGDIPNANPPGTIEVTEGSDVVEGDSETEFDRCIIGRFIQVAGDCTAYEVLELLAPSNVGASPTSGMRLKIDRPYEGPSDVALSYVIYGHPNRLYNSEPLEPEYWPAINFIDTDPGDGDFLTAAITNFNRLVICKRRKTYVVSFREQPIVEVVVPTLISKDIGCIAARSVAQVASGSVWLAERGLAIYDGRGVQAIPEVAMMNDLFVNPENPNYMRRDPNGTVMGAAGVFYPRREQYLLLIPTVQTQRGANLILVWDTELRNVTLLQFCQEFLSIEVARDMDGNERVYLGDTNGFVWIWDVGDTDGIGFPNATGTVRGTITAAGLDPSTGASFLEDGSASFLIGGIPGLGDLSGLAGLSGLTGATNMGLAGACLFWRPADAALGTPWQSRFIYASSSTRLYVTPNWGPDTPSVGDDYMLGPIRFEAHFKPTNYGTDDFKKRDWRQVVVHEPEAVSTMLRTELLRDFQNSDVDEDTVTDAAGETGEGRTFDLGFGKGRQIRPVGRLVHDFMGVRLSNFAPEEPLTIINHVLMVEPKTSR